MGLFTIVPVLILGWMQLAFESFRGAHWYYPVVLTLQAIFMFTQIRVLILVKRRRT